MNTLSYLSSVFSSATALPSSDDDDDQHAASSHPLAVKTLSSSPIPTESAAAGTDSPASDDDDHLAPSFSASAEPSQDTTNDEEPDTLYISARRGSRPGEPPRISVSFSNPAPSTALRRSDSSSAASDASMDSEHALPSLQAAPPPYDPSDGALPESPIKKHDEGWFKAAAGDEGTSSSPSTSSQAMNAGAIVSEEEAGERKLRVKEIERLKLVEASLSWPVRISVRLFLFFRQFLAYMGWRYRSSHPSTIPSLLTAELDAQLAAASSSSLSSTTPTSDNTPTMDDDKLSPLSASTSTRRTSSSFFLRRTSTTSPNLSRSSSPSSSSSTAATTPPLPRAPPRMTPKTLVLDLDETLIHSTSRPYNPARSGTGLKMKTVEVVLDGKSTVYTVYKRPWVDFFLRKVSTWYTVIVFTASLPEYADPVIDWLDGGDGTGGMVSGRLFRSDCLHTNGAYVKDLSVVDADLSRVCLVDNSPASYAINQANGIPIEGWINDPYDECLLDLLPMLDSLRFTSDVRRVLGLRGFEKI